MIRVLHAEWTKLRTDPAARWLLPAIAVATVLGSRTGLPLGQPVVVLFAVLAIGGEHGAGLLRIAFTAMPRRSVVLAAKAVLIGGLTLVASLGTGIRPVLIGLLALGVAAVIRDSAASAGAVFALLYAAPLVAAVINDPELQRALRRFAPMTAGLGVLAAWSAAALVIGALVLGHRDP